jgi:glutamyl-Q tRNA(Asp) synthetase
MSMAAAYIGRFAPSPSGPLHAGSVVAALASWLDARAHHGQWLVRIEDTDTPRCRPGMDQFILGQLATLGLHPDTPALWQSQRGVAYQQAIDQLIATGWLYACGCSRRDVDDALSAAGRKPLRHALRLYPGTCRHGLHGRTARSLRMRTQRDGCTTHIDWADRRLGAQSQDVAHEVGDFVLKRADGLWAYQLAVVVDDAWQAVSHVVRGEDLADNTARQILLQRALGLPTPGYLHTPLVLGADGHKLSKQNGAEPLAPHDPVAVLQRAAHALELPVIEAPSAAQWLAAALPQWAARWVA